MAMINYGMGKLGKKGGGEIDEPRLHFRMSRSGDLRGSGLRGWIFLRWRNREERRVERSMSKDSTVRDDSGVRHNDIPRGNYTQRRSWVSTLRNATTLISSQTCSKTQTTHHTPSDGYEYEHDIDVEILMKLVFQPGGGASL